jgi:hypothetical protein
MAAYGSHAIVSDLLRIQPVLSLISPTFFATFWWLHVTLSVCLAMLLMYLFGAYYWDVFVPACVL